MKKSSLAEMREEYMKKPVTANTIEIDGVSYTVVSRYIGGRELTATVRANAERQAYEDLKKKA